MIISKCLFIAYCEAVNNNNGSEYIYSNNTILVLGSITLDPERICSANISFLLDLSVYDLMN